MGLCKHTAISLKISAFLGRPATILGSALLGMSLRIPQPTPQGGLNDAYNSAKDEVIFTTTTMTMTT
jgi:hypothetical protein